MPGHCQALPGAAILNLTQHSSKRSCQTKANSFQFVSNCNPSGGKKAAPFDESGGAVRLEEGAGGEAAFLIEVVLYRGVDSGELL